MDIIGMWEEPPEMVSLNGHECPKPYSGQLEYAQRYYHIDCFFGRFEVRADIYIGSVRDNQRVEAGIVHLTQEAAQAHADALNAVHKELIK